MSSPGMIVPPREGESAFARSVSTLYDLTVGLVNWPVRFIRPVSSNPEQPPLTLAHDIDGAACLEILAVNRVDVVTRFTNRGIDVTQVGRYIDFVQQQDPDTGVPEPPDAPAAGSNLLRMYAHNGNVYFKYAGSALEFVIPTGEAPSAPARYSYWLAGG